MKQNPNTAGYLCIILCLSSKPIKRTIHQLVAEAFLNHIPNGNRLVVDHIDNEKSNNKLSNLQVITQRENLSKDRSGMCEYTGVTLKGTRFRSAITINKKRYHLSYCDSAKEASEIYNKALLDYENGTLDILT